MFKLLLLLPAFAIGTFSPAAAQLKIANDADVQTAVGDCLDATSGNGVDAEKLVAAGWSLGSMSNDGKDLEMPFGIYGKSDSAAIIMTPNNKSDTSQVCAVTARVSSFDKFQFNMTAFTDKFGEPIKREDNEVIWRGDGKLIQLAATGSRSEPSLRVAVIALSGDK